MILGLSIEAFVTLHVAISLAGIATGLVALTALAAGRWLGGWHAVFLVTTAATSITGFLFPIGAITPALVFGAVSLLVIAVAFVALYERRLRRRAGAVYAASATLALWLNMFVLVVQSFLKVPALNELAPTQAEAPFVVAQALVLTACVTVGILAARASYRAAPAA